MKNSLEGLIIQTLWRRLLRADPSGRGRVVVGQEKNDSMTEFVNISAMYTLLYVYHSLSMSWQAFELGFVFHVPRPGQTVEQRIRLLLGFKKNVARRGRR